MARTGAGTLGVTTTWRCAGAWDFRDLFVLFETNFLLLFFSLWRFESSLSDRCAEGAPVVSLSAAAPSEHQRPSVATAAS
jgi:hypothetical protein